MKRPTIESAKAKAIERITEEEFHSLTEQIQNAIVDIQYKNLVLEWEKQNMESADKRSSEARMLGRSMKARSEPNRVGFRRPKKRSAKLDGEKEILQVSCEFPSVEMKPVVLVRDKLMGFNIETILGLKPTIESMIKRATDHDNVERPYKASIKFYIPVGATRRISTKLVPVFLGEIDENIKVLYNELDDLVKKVEKADSGYEYVFEGEQTNYINFEFMLLCFLTPGCVKNWGKGIKPVERRRDFNIFTASGDESCVLQCAKRMWPVDPDSPDERDHKEATEDTIDKIKARAKGRLCIVTPQCYIESVHEISEYADIKPHPWSPIKTMSVIHEDAWYLIWYKNHLGMLDSMEEPKRNIYATKFRPLMEYPECKKLTVCFDIECYFDPCDRTEKHTRHIPYLCCACFIYDDNIGNVVEFDGPDCVAKMLDYAAEVSKGLENKHVELIAHNGGGYDFHYILSSMYDPGAVKNILIRNNTFISFNFTHESVVFYVKDSLNYLLCSLNKAAKAFLVDENGEVEMNKTDFPHHEVRTRKDLEKTFREWLSVKEEISLNIEKEKMLITSEHVIKYKDKGAENKSLMEWARRYCCNDVVVLANVWVAFKNAVFNIFNCHIVDQTYTLAGMSFRLFEAHLPPKVYLQHPSKDDFDNMRMSLVGGRCISMNGIYKNITCLDVKSLYPAAMAFYDQPYGAYRRVKKRVQHELGIYYVKVTPFGSLSPAARQSRLDSKEHGFFPLKNNREETMYISTGKIEHYKAWYTTVDIDIGLAEGHKIETIPFDACDNCLSKHSAKADEARQTKGMDVNPCEHGHVGYSWKNRGKIFKGYIKDVLYRLKLEYEQNNNAVKRQVIKIIMNSLWGKFAQNWMDTNYKVKAVDDADFGKEECYEISGTEHVLVKTHRARGKYSSKPVQNGVFTLSWARWHMREIWLACTEPGAQCLYSDTDSIFIHRDQLRLNAVFNLDGEMMDVLGSEVGQLEIECELDELICVGKKQYIGSYLSAGKQEEPPVKKYKKRFKGVPQQFIKPELFTHLINSPSNKAQIDFLKFKREWGVVSACYESKTVTQTF